MWWKKNKGNTTKDTTTQNTTTSDSTPTDTTSYEVTKEVFESYFKTDTAAKVLASNYTLDVTDKLEGVDIESTRKIDNGKAIIDGGFQMYVDITADELGNLELDAYDYDSDADKWSNLAELDYDVDIFTNKYLLPILDYTKLTYNATTHKYTSSQEITFEDENEFGAKDVFKYTNIVISFENNALKSITFSVNEKDYEDEDNFEEYDYTRTMVIKEKGSTTINSPVRNMVNERTFISFLGGLNYDILKGLNYTAHYSYAYTAGGTYSAEADIKADNGLFLVDYDPGTPDEVDYYYETEEGIDYDSVSFCQYEFDGSNWGISHEGANSVRAFLYNNIYLTSFDYDDFTYNYETKMYEADSIDIGSNQYRSNVKIKFEDKKIVSCSYTYTYYDNDGETVIRSWNTSTTFTNVGTTEVESPLPESGFEDVFNSYFGIDTFEKLEVANYTLKITTINGDETRTRTRKVNGSEILDSGTGVIPHTDNEFIYESYYLIKEFATHYSYDEAYNYDNTGFEQAPGGSSSALNGIVCYFYLPKLDYSKVSFDDANQKYISSESITYSIIVTEDVDITYTNTISNIEIVFEENVLKSISYDVSEVASFTYYDDEEEKDVDVVNESEYKISIDVSEVGTTDFDTPEYDKWD